MAHITEVSDSVLFGELDNCKVAKALLSKSAYSRKWKRYESAIKQEIDKRNSSMSNISDDELLAELNA